jgi:AcrR family transcriptional regulator
MVAQGPKPATPKPTARSTYRHGDLRRALLDAGIALAQSGGPDAVVLREATRRAGVVPNAAYRHFASRLELLREVRMAALSRLALSMEAELDALSPTLGSAALARASLRAIGVGYLHFALTETGLFRTIFAVPYDWPAAPDPAKAGSTGLNPFQLLGVALDRMVDAHVLSTERRNGAEFLAWSAVHGFAMLVIEGPLRGLSRAQTDALGRRVVDMVEKGL